MLLAVKGLAFRIVEPLSRWWSLLRSERGRCGRSTVLFEVFVHSPQSGRVCLTQCVKFQLRGFQEYTMGPLIFASPHIPQSTLIPSVFDSGLSIQLSDQFVNVEHSFRVLGPSRSRFWTMSSGLLMFMRVSTQKESRIETTSCEIPNRRTPPISRSHPNLNPKHQTLNP